jgi:hypothetical protein
MVSVLNAIAIIRPETPRSLASDPKEPAIEEHGPDLFRFDLCIWAGLEGKSEKNSLPLGRSQARIKFKEPQSVIRIHVVRQADASGWSRVFGMRARRPASQPAVCADAVVHDRDRLLADRG